MFPNAVSILGIALGIYQLLILVPKIAVRYQNKLENEVCKTYVPPWLSFLGLGAYLLSLYVIGFPPCDHYLFRIHGVDSGLSAH